MALLAYATPLYLQRGKSTASQDDLTQDYIRSMRLLQNTARWAASACPALPMWPAIFSLQSDIC